MDLELADLAKRDGPTDLQMDGRTYGKTDKPAYKDAWTHLDTRYISIVCGEILDYWLLSRCNFFSNNPSITIAYSIRCEGKHN